MPRLKMRRNASFFATRSSSCGRETNYPTFLFLLFSSLCFPVVRPHDVQANCGGSYDIKKEGHRLEATVYKRINVLLPMDCAVQCFGEFCCRSANVRKTPFQDGKENCELLHALAKEKPEKLKMNDNYDYLEVGREEPFNCLCSSCINGGNCSGISKKCSCSPGYNGTQCENDINECISNPCDTNAKCKDGINSYTCKCKKGFSGDGNSCTDIDECISNPCDTNAKCVDGINSYTCECKKEFTGDGISCTDIDECISNPCHTNTTCENDIGSFTCKCNEGFIGDGTYCTGKRLHSIVLKKEVTSSAQKCKNRCVQDDCCRSINYRKNESICELLHAVKNDSWNLKGESGYEYYELNNTDRKYNPTACYWCKNGGKCGVQSKKCRCPDPVNQGSPECNNGSLNSSIILEGNCTYLNALYKWLGNKTQWCLCYGAVDDKLDPTEFHSKCDKYQHTVTIVRSINEIVGGYSDVAWSNGDGYASSSNAFLFFLKSQYSPTVFKSPLITSRAEKAIFRKQSWGPSFGEGRDLHITKKKCYSFTRFGRTYQLPAGVTYNSEKNYFCLSIIEVFYEC